MKRVISRYRKNQLYKEIPKIEKISNEYNTDIQNIETDNQYLNDSNTASHEMNKNKKYSRQENSLGELTKNFIKYIKESGKQTININELVKKLKVKKMINQKEQDILRSMQKTKYHGYIMNTYLL